MLTKENFNKDHIEKLHRESGSDPILLERVLYAFGLLEVHESGEAKKGWK